MQCCDPEEFSKKDARSRQLHHSCTIGNYEFGKALCNSRASISLMPLYVAKSLSLGELTPTSMTFQMADITMAQPEGILEDVLIKVGKFFFSL